MSLSFRHDEIVAVDYYKEDNYKEDKKLSNCLSSSQFARDLVVITGPIE